MKRTGKRMMIFSGQEDRSLCNWFYLFFCFLPEWVFRMYSLPPQVLPNLILTIAYTTPGKKIGY